MQELILTSVTFEQLKNELTNPILKDLAYLKAILIDKEQTELLTRKEAAKLLGVSLPTLLEWTKNGQVQGYRISSRIRYKRTELENSLKRIKTCKN